MAKVSTYCMMFSMRSVSYRVVIRPAQHGFYIHLQYFFPMPMLAALSSRGPYSFRKLQTYVVSFAFLTLPPSAHPPPPPPPPPRFPHFPPSFLLPSSMPSSSHFSLPFPLLPLCPPPLGILIMFIGCCLATKSLNLNNTKKNAGVVVVMKMAVGC